MTRYSRAYPLERLQAGPEWSGHARTDVLRAACDSADGKYLFLHDNYVVTHGIRPDRGIVFDAVTPAWKAYCREVLKFEPPAYLAADDRAD